jgi:hypothetical protein
MLLARSGGRLSTMSDSGGRPSAPPTFRITNVDCRALRTQDQMAASWPLLCGVSVDSLRALGFAVSSFSPVALVAFVECRCDPSCLGPTMIDGIHSGSHLSVLGLTRQSLAVHDPKLLRPMPVPTPALRL